MSGRGPFELDGSQRQAGRRFDDVAGVDEARAELAETIEFLRNPERFKPPGWTCSTRYSALRSSGNGQDLLARAAAKEAGVAFLAASGSSFQEKFAASARHACDTSSPRDESFRPCMIFIDEIDALGRQRGRGGDSASADQDQTLNQLLVEMDGFDQSRARGSHCVD